MLIASLVCFVAGLVFFLSIHVRLEREKSILPDRKITNYQIVIL